MANFTYEILKDTTKQTVIKITGIDLTSDESSPSKIVANSLYRALDVNNNLLVTGNTAKPFYGLSVYRIWYDIGFKDNNAIAYLTWKDANNTPIISMSGCGEYNTSGNWIAIRNPMNSGATGDIGFFTKNVVSGSYSVIIELHKDNNYYDAGQLIEPNAFNYGKFGVTP